MKKLILFTIMAISTSLVAQEVETFWCGGKFKSSGYGTLSTSFTRVNDKNAIFAGAYGGWMINHEFMIGLGGYGMVTNQTGFNPGGETDSDRKLEMGYGGLMLEYTLLSSKKIHASTNMLIGAGGVVNTDGDLFSSNVRNEDESAYAVIQPSINVELNMTNWFRVAVGGGYRFIQGSSLVGLSDKSLSAPTMNVTLKFGKF